MGLQASFCASKDGDFWPLIDTWTRSTNEGLADALGVETAYGETNPDEDGDYPPSPVDADKIDWEKLANLEGCEWHPGVTIEEVKGLVAKGYSFEFSPNPRIGKVIVEGDDDFTEEFLYEFRKHVPKDWDIRIADGRLEVREWADRPEPLFHFDVTRHDSFELIVGIPEIIGVFIGQMHRDFCELRKFTKEAVVGCVDPGELAGPVVAKAKSMPVSWELSEGIEDVFPEVIIKKPARQAPHPGLRCLQCGLGVPLGEMTDHQKNCIGDKNLRLCPLCNGTGKERFEVMGKKSPQRIPCSRCGGSGTVPKNEVDG